MNGPHPTSQHPNSKNLHHISITIFVTNFPTTVSSKDLWKLCDRQGVVADVYNRLRKFIKIRLTSTSGFVSFIKNPDSRRNLLEDINKICVVIAKGGLSVSGLDSAVDRVTSQDENADENIAMEGYVSKLKIKTTHHGIRVGFYQGSQIQRSGNDQDIHSKTSPREGEINDKKEAKRLRMKRYLELDDDVEKDIEICFYNVTEKIGVVNNNMVNIPEVANDFLHCSSYLHARDSENAGAIEIPKGNIQGSSSLFAQDYLCGKGLFQSDYRFE
ncbi:RNA-directed DNA polymerase, eukaryota [Tanacetum coccineum]